MEKDDKYCLAMIEDEAEKCQRENRITSTDFLDMRLQGIAETEIKSRGVRYSFDGGYDGAERRIIVFLPEYASIDDFRAESPIEILRVIHKMGGKELTHRDYLGSILGLGISRSKIGDIIVYPNGADIIILKDMEEFLLANYEKAGRAELSLSIEPIDLLNLSSVKTVTITDTIASLRLDSVLSVAFRASRTKAQDAIKEGFVFLNGASVLKPDKEVQKGDVIVLRGRGKCVLEDIGGNSKKGRTFITVKRYM